MDALIKLLPRLRKRESGHSRPPVVVRRAAKQPQTIILEGVLDISKEARDALVEEGRKQQHWEPFEIAFPSPTLSGCCFSPGTSAEAQITPRPSPASPLPSPSRSSPPHPHSAVVAIPYTAAAAGSLGDVPASQLSRRRNFHGQPILTSLTIPPMPTTPPPCPCPFPRPSSASGSSLSSSRSRSLRRQPRFTHLNTASPIRRCRTFPLSTDSPAPVSTLASAPCAPRSARSSALVAVVRLAEGKECTGSGAKDGHTSTTPPGTPTPKPTDLELPLAFPLPPRRATFTKRFSGPAAALHVSMGMPHSAAREMFPIGELGGGGSAEGVEPLCIVKRASVAATALGSVLGRPTSLVMDELFSSLDDAYVELQDPSAALEEGADEFMSISLSDSEDGSGGAASVRSSDSDDIEEDLDGEVTWRLTYSLTEEYASFFPSTFGSSRRPSTFGPLPPDAATASEEREMRLCAYSFLMQRTQSLSSYRAQGSRSAPDLSL
ncbi:hypothetical protein B0H11DRAFT_1985969, partial [Mycena galericulata]